MADAHFNLANLLLEHDDFAEAGVHYGQALRLRPDWREARQGLEMAEEAASDTPMPDDGPPRVPERAVDPARDGHLLADLQKLADSAQALGRELGEESAHEIEKAVKEVSTALLKPDTPAHALAAKLDALRAATQRFESLDTRVEELQAHLAGARTRIAGA